jgi:hypothetical protein
LATNATEQMPMNPIGWTILQQEEKLWGIFGKLHFNGWTI